MIQGNIFNIQRYTIHDGPGIRTELFLKGCPLSCKWCGNPESWISDIQPGVYGKRCIGMEACGLCMDACPGRGALIFQRGAAEVSNRLDDSVHRLTAIDRNACMGCMECARSCPTDAIKQWGRWMTVDEAMDAIRRDVSYYESSGGGVTISGGEPLLQADFVIEVFKRCRQEKIHTCLESTFCVEWRIIENVVPYADMLITDIKHMNPEAHKQYTGVSNERILGNLRRISTLGKPIIVRIPVIPGVNDDMADMALAADFILEEMGGRVELLQLLGFMRLGEEKYESLGIPYEMAGLEINREAFHEHMLGLARYFESRDIHCLVGTKERE